MQFFDDERILTFLQRAHFATIICILLSIASFYQFLKEINQEYWFQLEYSTFHILVLDHVGLKNGAVIIFEFIEGFRSG